MRYIIIWVHCSTAIYYNYAENPATYSRPGTPPPPAPKPAVIEMLTTEAAEANMFGIVKNYGREEHEVAPPSPKEAPPTHQVSGGGASAEQRNYGRDKPRRSPPTPAHAPPTHQVGKDGGGVAPPAPHHAPPTHQVTGGGAAEMEESWVYELLSASA